MAMKVALEDGGGAVALEDGVGRQLKIAVAAVGGGGEGRICNDGISVSIVEAKGLLLQHWHQHWQGQQERTRPMQGTYIGSNGKDTGVLQRRWQWRQCRYNNCINKARARVQWRRTSTGEARAMQRWHHNRSGKREGKWLGKSAH
jgi:hypothetical protein